MQRVAIARAIVGSPHYIFADEPTGALDNENTEKILSVLQQINKTGVGVIIVTHDMDVANQCKRIIRLEDGAIVDDRLRHWLNCLTERFQYSGKRGFRIVFETKCKLIFTVKSGMLKIKISIEFWGEEDLMCTLSPPV